jgi:hypothetical protein
VRNAATTGEILLKRGNQERKYRLRPVPDAEKPDILKLYLDSYTSPKCSSIFPCLPVRHLPRFAKSPRTTLSLSRSRSDAPPYRKAIWQRKSKYGKSLRPEPRWLPRA